MSAPIIDINKLTIVPGTGTGSFTHRIGKGRFPGDKRVFYKKEMTSPSVAYSEVLAQEFFRLIIPSQPETRIARSKANTYFILSDAIDGYKPLPIGSSLFTLGAYKGLGLGQIMMAAVFLQEIDLKNGNICLNEDKQVLKIDGDWCFGGMRDPRFNDYNKDITPELISSLPFPATYDAYNWLDISIRRFAKAESKIVGQDLSLSPYFRNEINEAMLKLLVLPDDYLRKFVDAFIPASPRADIFINYFKDRREELKRAALQDNSFKEYLKSPLAKEYLSLHLLQMKSFVANGNYPIIDVSEYESIDETIFSIFDGLCEDSALNSNPLSAFECLEQLEIDFSSRPIKKLMLAYRDLLLKKIDNYVELFSKSANNDHSDRKIRLMRLAAEKKNLIHERSTQLEKRFNALEQFGMDYQIKCFTQKQKAMSVKSLSNANYAEAAKEAHLFCNCLYQARNKFLSLDRSFEQARNDFKSDCLLAVNNARDVLDSHREWKGRIKKFVIDILYFLTLGLSPRLGLFGKTDSGVKLDNLEQVTIKTFN